jgi:hypothetical protein
MQLPATPVAYSNAYTRDLDANGGPVMIVAMTVAMTAAIIAITLALDNHAARSALTPATARLVANQSDLLGAAIKQRYPRIKRGGGNAAGE